MDNQLKEKVKHPKMIKMRGYLVWGRAVGARDPWMKRLLDEGSPEGWYATVSRDGEVFAITEQHTDLQSAMEAGIALVKELPEREELP